MQEEEQKAGWRNEHSRELLGLNTWPDGLEEFKSLTKPSAFGDSRIVFANGKCKDVLVHF